MLTDDPVPVHSLTVLGVASGYDVEQKYLLLSGCLVGSERLGR
jgi:hypothetical protein